MNGDTGMDWDSSDSSEDYMAAFRNKLIYVVGKSGATGDAAASKRDDRCYSILSPMSCPLDSLSVLPEATRHPAV